MKLFTPYILTITNFSSIKSFCRLISLAEIFFEKFVRCISITYSESISPNKLSMEKLKSEKNSLKNHKTRQN